MYPMTHILAASSFYTTGLNTELLVMLLPTAFFLFYTISFHLFSKVFAQTNGQSLLMTSFGSLLLFRDMNSMFFPTLQCFQLVPFILFLLCKAKIDVTRSSIYMFLLIIMLLLVPFTHPGEGTLFLLTILLYFSFAYLLLNREIMPKSFLGNIFNFKGMIGVIGIILIVWITWFSSFAIYADSIKIVYNWLILHSGESTFNIYNEQYADKIAKSGLSLFQFTNLFFKMYGQYAIYYLIAFAISLRFWLEFLLKPQKASPDGIILSCLFWFLGVASAALILIISYQSITRFQNWLFFSATVLNGYGLYEILSKKNGNLAGLFLVCIILIITATVGLFNVFPSPLIYDCNFQVTHTNLIEIEWFLKHQNDEIGNLQIGSHLYGFSCAVVGHNRIPRNVLDSDILDPPEHFGYRDNKMLGILFNEDLYFVDNQFSRIMPLIYSEYINLLKFTPNDFHNLNNNDVSASVIYVNGDSWTYYIKSQKT
jgi:hypothetical protein